jgi:hypothetical protein
MRRRNQLVDLLLERIRPLVERLARDLAHIAAARIERELGRVGEAVEVALSAFATEDRMPIQIGEIMIPCRTCGAAPGEDCRTTEREAADAPIRSLGRDPHKRRAPRRKKVSELLDW